MSTGVSVCGYCALVGPQWLVISAESPSENPGAARAHRHPCALAASSSAAETSSPLAGRLLFEYSEATYTLDKDVIQCRHLTNSSFDNLQKILMNFCCFGME